MVLSCRRLGSATHKQVQDFTRLAEYGHLVPENRPPRVIEWRLAGVFRWRVSQRRFPHRKFPLGLRRVVAAKVPLWPSLARMMIGHACTPRGEAPERMR